MSILQFPGHLPYRCCVCGQFIKVNKLHYAIKALEREAPLNGSFPYETTVHVIHICRECSKKMNFNNLKPPKMFP